VSSEKAGFTYSIVPSRSVTTTETGLWATARFSFSSASFCSRRRASSSSREGRPSISRISSIRSGPGRASPGR